MTVKNKIFWSGLLGLLLCWACVDDRGNYTYEDPEAILPPKISGLSDTTFRIPDIVTLTPEIEGLENEDDYWFTWYTYRGGTGIPVRDTICRSRNLSFQMMYPAGESRTLVYEIKDKKTGVFVNKKVSFYGVAEFNKGWLVLNDENDQTDIDFGFPDGSVREDILWESQQLKLQGTAVAIVFQSQGYYHQVTNPDGTVTTVGNLRAWHVLSSRDMMSLNTENLAPYKHFDEQFYAVPEVAAPQAIMANGNNILMNAGRLYSISGSSSNIGKFGYPRLDYENLFPALMNGEDGNTLVFSRDARSFVMTNIYDMNLRTFHAPDKENSLQVSSTNMNADMIALLQRDSKTAWALMKSVSGPGEYYLADINFKGTDYPFVAFDTLSSDRNLLQADVYAANQSNSIWFAKGNVLSYYSKEASDAVSYEVPNIYPFPNGETITWMKRMNGVSDSEGKGHIYLVVVTNSNAGWKLYRFELEGDGLRPSLKPGTTPVIWSGKGFARYVEWIQ